MFVRKYIHNNLLLFYSKIELKSEHQVRCHVLNIKKMMKY